jgi:hypothetical protein
MKDVWCVEECGLKRCLMVVTIVLHACTNTHIILRPNIVLMRESNWGMLATMHR